MQHIKEHSRRQWVFISCAILLLAVVAVVPWQVVAQEAKTESPATPLTPQVDSQVPSEVTTLVADTATEEIGGKPIAPKSMNEKLVGAWRGGSSNNMIHFKADGTYDEPVGTLIHSGDAVEGGLQGAWELKVTSEKLWLHITPTASGGIMRGLPTLPNQRRSYSPGTSYVLQVLHVDDNFLRLSESHDGSAVFFRRAKPEDEAKKAKDDFSLPADVRLLAELGQLLDDEAKALAAEKVDYFKAWKVDEPQLKLLLRLAKARRGEIDFAELFELDKDEAAAYAKLYEMTTGRLQTIRALVDQGQLTEVEQRAAKKIDKAVTTMSKTLGTLHMSIVEANRGKIGPRPFMPSMEPKHRAIGKLVYGLSDLISYLNNFEAAQSPKQTSSPYALPPQGGLE